MREWAIQLCTVSYSLMDLPKVTLSFALAIISEIRTSQFPMARMLFYIGMPLPVAGQNVIGKQILDPLLHLIGSLIGEGEGEDILRLEVLL